MTPKPNKILAAAEAERLWGLYDFKTPQQLIIENVAMAQGVLVMDGHLDSSTARLVRGGDMAIARISDRIRESGRRRFAIAHELGHWMLHRAQAHLLACTDHDIYATHNSNPLEVEASTFAGVFLMPEHLYAERTAGRLPTTSTIKDLAAYFGTSVTATALRYVETSEDYCVFVLSESNRIRWWRASVSFSNHQLWIDNRTTLPRASPAACFFRGEAVPSKPQCVDFNQWLGDMPGIHSDKIIEQAIPLPSYNQVISLLWLP